MHSRFYRPFFYVHEKSLSINTAGNKASGISKRAVLSILFFLVLMLIGITSNAQLKRFSFTTQKMGAPFNIIVYCDDSAKAAAFATQSFNLVDSFVQIFSDYIDTSELSRLSAAAGSGEVFNLSPAMYDMLCIARHAFYKSDGAFDVTMGPLVKLWRKARKLKIFPPDAEVQQAKELIGFKKMQIDTLNKTATLTQKGMLMDLGGIAQGYIAQKVADFLKRMQVEHALVNVSGDIVTIGVPPGSNGWTVGINVPESTDELLPKTLLIRNMAVTTSGDVYQYLEHNGKRYSHIIDPRTGYGLTSLKNVTVIAKDGTTADWLATACSILSVKKAIHLAGQCKAEVMIAEIKKGKLKLWVSKGFTNYFNHSPG